MAAASRLELSRSLLPCSEQVRDNVGGVEGLGLTECVFLTQSNKSEADSQHAGVAGDGYGICGMA